VSDFRERIPDDDRVVPIDDEQELKLPPPTLDPLEAVEEDVDELTDEERRAAIEAGEIES
jgi:Flp pilus assembly CpaF family ATPase